MQIQIATIDSYRVLSHTANMDGAVKFGALIKSAREAKGLTGQELAAKLGRAHSFVVMLFE